MTKPFINPVMIELRDAISEAESLSTRPEFGKREEARLNVLLAKVAALRSNAIAPSDAEQRFFRTLLSGADLPVEQRNDLASGKQTLNYTSGSTGGFFVPQEFYNRLLLGMAQYDPLLDKDKVTLIESTDDSLRPIRIPGWDLSTFAAAKITEANQQNPQTVPTASGVQLNGFPYRASLTETFEFNEDSFMTVADLMNLAFQIAFARGIGADLATGDGTTGPQGVLTGAVASGVTTAISGSINKSDINKVYFSLNRWYRASPKCAWVVSDAVYQELRDAVDNNGRPLLQVINDRETLCSKPVLVSPSIPSGGGADGIVFGDLAHFCVRVSRTTIRRSINAAQGGADFGKTLYTGHTRADAKVVDPTGGSKPPIVYAQLHS